MTGEVLSPFKRTFCNDKKLLQKVRLLSELKRIDSESILCREEIPSIEELQNNIGLWKVELGKLTDADYILGYGFDEVKGQWKVFQNSERGMHLEWYFEMEEEALLKLYKKIKFQYKIIH